MNRIDRLLLRAKKLNTVKNTTVKKFDIKLFNDNLSKFAVDEDIDNIDNWFKKAYKGGLKAHEEQQKNK